MLGIYFLLDDREHFTFLSWSIADHFQAKHRVVDIFLILKRPFRRLIKNVFFAFLPQIPNIGDGSGVAAASARLYTVERRFLPRKCRYFYRVSGTFSRELSRLLGAAHHGLFDSLICTLCSNHFHLLYKRDINMIDNIMLVALATITISTRFLDSPFVIPYLIPYLLWLSRKDRWIFKWKLLCS